MSAAEEAPRRVRVERNIYRRSTGVLEIGFKDAAGVQRWRTVDGGIMAARKLRDDLLPAEVEERWWFRTRGFGSVRPQIYGWLGQSLISGIQRRPAIGTQ